MASSGSAAFTSTAGRHSCENAHPGHTPRSPPRPRMGHAIPTPTPTPAAATPRAQTSIVTRQSGGSAGADAEGDAAWEQQGND